MIYVSCDHGGFNIKDQICEYIRSLGREFEYLGPTEFHGGENGDDFNDYANQLCSRMSENDIGILFCDTGIGMSMAANRYRNIRAALCSSIFDALRAREHNNANVMCFGSETNELDTIEAMLKVFLETPFSGLDRYIRRNQKLS